jgi:hypothetical protein
LWGQPFRAAAELPLGVFDFPECLKQLRKAPDITKSVPLAVLPPAVLLKRSQPPGFHQTGEATD